MSPEQHYCILASIIRYGRQEFNRQRKEISDLTEVLIAQAKLHKDQQEAQKRTYNAAKATYDESAEQRSEVEGEVVALQGQAEGQGVAVTTLLENNTLVLKLQWQALTSKPPDDPSKFINIAITEFDIVKTDLGNFTIGPKGQLYRSKTTN